MCDCKTPMEHIEHLWREQLAYRKLHPEPITYVIVREDGTEEEVTKEEFDEYIRA